MKTNRLFGFIVSACFWATVNHHSLGDTIAWTNAAGGNWSVPENWEPNQVPGGGDTAIITNLGTYTVTLDTMTSNSLGTLVLGSGEGQQTLAIPNGGLVCASCGLVNPSGVLSLQMGRLEGSFQIAGTVNFLGGSLNGRLIVDPAGVLNINLDSSTLYMEDLATITNYGIIRWSGNGGMIAGRDNLVTPELPGIHNMAGGLLEIQGDVGIAPEMWEGSTIILRNAGMFRKVSGSTGLCGVDFVNTGAVEVLQGNLGFWGSVTSFFVSSGTFHVAANAMVRLGNGRFIFQPGHQTLGDGFFGIDAGNVELSGELNGHLDWTGGSLSGGWVIGTNGLLNIVAGSTPLYLEDTAAITNCGIIRCTGNSVILGRDNLATPELPGIYNLAGGLLEIQGDVGIAPEMWEGSTIILRNAGMLRKVSGSTGLSGVDFVNTGAVEVLQGNLGFWESVTSFFVSSGTFQVAANAMVRLNNGRFNFQPGHQTLGEGFFGVDCGNVELRGELNGHLDWTGGSLSGGWIIGTNGLLNISTGSIPLYLEDTAAITNYGIIRCTGNGVILGRDNLATPELPGIYNMAGGLLEIQGDVGIAPEMWEGSTIILRNAGMLRKVSGSTGLSGVDFVNTGTVEVLQGNLGFWETGTCSFVSSGTFQVAANAMVRLNNGRFNFQSGHQSLGEGFFGVDFGNVELRGELNGHLDWTGGSLSGGWVIGTNGLLNITAGSSPLYLEDTAAITNHGIIRCNGNGMILGRDNLVTLELPGIYNMAGGLLEIQGDVGIATDMWGVSAIILRNAGMLRKVSGWTGLSEVDFVNTGAVEVLQGNLGFWETGTCSFVSSGTFQVAANAMVRLNNGRFIFQPGHQSLGEGFFGVDFGNVELRGELNGHLDWTGGSLSGGWVIGTNGLLNITAGSSPLYLDDTAAITNYGIIHCNGNGMILGRDNLSTPELPGIYNMAGGLLEIQGDVGIATDMWGVSAIILRNAGMLRKVSGWTGLSEVDFVNTGAVEVLQGNLGFWETGTSSFVSSGTFQVAANAMVRLNNGRFNFQPGHQTLGEGFFGVDFGNVELSGELNGRLDWSGGGLASGLTIGVGGTLNIIESGNTKYLLPGAKLTNYGTVLWMGGPIIGNSGASIHNQLGGVFEIHSDAQLGAADGNNERIEFVNAGLVRKVEGAGTTVLKDVQFVHTGNFEVQQGGVFFYHSYGPQERCIVSSGHFQMAEGTRVFLDMGGYVFEPGHLAEGNGLFGIDGQSVSLQGAISGRFDWLSGTLGGSFSINTNGVLNALTNQPKYIGDYTGNGSSITNYGVINLMDSGIITFYMPGGNTLTNVLCNMPGGLINLQGEVRLENAGDRDTCLIRNAGLIQKQTNQGTATLANLRFENDGRIEVLRGSVNLGEFGSYGSDVILAGTLQLGLAASNDFGHVNLAGTAEVSGQLDVTSQGSFVPEVGQRFELLTYDTNAQVAFTNISLPTLPAGIYFVTLADTNRLVLEARRDPLVVNDSFTLDEDSTAELDPLANDSDLYGPLTLVSFTQPTHGVVTRGTGNLLQYQPVPYYAGPDAFSYQARSGDGRTASASVSLQVTPVNHAPVLASISNQITRPYQLLNLTFSATDPDLPANGLTYSLDSAPTNASLTSDGVFSWLPTFEQAGSTNAIVVRVTDNGIPALSATRGFQAVVLDRGLRADYFAGTNFNALVLSRNETVVSNYWGTNSPGPGVPPGQFSTRWTGRVIPRYTQTYTFHTASDDGVRLWVDGRLLVDNWTLHNMTTNTGTIALTANQPFNLKLEYFNAISNAGCFLMWSSTSQPKECVPESQLRCAGYASVISNAIYVIRPKVASTKAMQVRSGGTADGTQVEINNWNNKLSQKWRALDIGGGLTRLIPQHATTKAIDVNRGYTTNGTKVQIWTSTGSTNQQMRFVDMGQGWFKIVPQNAPASVLEVKNGATANGTPVQLYQDTGANAQRWRLDRQ